MQNQYSPIESILGIRHYVSKHTAEVATPLDIETSSADLEALKKAVAACTRCTLHQTRHQTVFGVGNPKAKLMIIGEAPGETEDQQGEPFVGAGGKLLTLMLQSIGFEREDVYIANILKCRTPNNRDPHVEEVSQCTTYLDQQIQMIKPQMLLAVGRIAAHYLLKTKASLESLRQQVHQYRQDNTPLIVTYHPAYLLRTPQDKRKAYSDLLFTKSHLQALS